MAFHLLRWQSITWLILYSLSIGRSCSQHLSEWLVTPCKYIAIHHSDVIMGAMASQIISLTIVYSTVYSGADQRKHQSSASLAFVWEIHRWPVNSLHKWPVKFSIWWRHHDNVHDRSDHGFRKWLVANLVPSHYLKQRKIFVTWTFRGWRQWNFIWITVIAMKWIA